MLTFRRLFAIFWLLAGLESQAYTCFEPLGQHGDSLRNDLSGDPQPEFSTVPTRGGFYLFGPNGAISFFSNHGVGFATLDAPVFDATHRGILKRQLGQDKLNEVLQSSDPYRAVNNALREKRDADRKSKGAENSNSVVRPKKLKNGKFMDIDSAERLFSEIGKKINRVGSEQRIPDYLLQEAASYLAATGRVHKNDLELVRYKTNSVKQEQYIGRTLVKFLDYTVIIGPVEKARPTIKIRVYTDGIHITAGGFVEAIFGDNRIERVEPGALEYTKGAYSDEVEYTRGYLKSEYGRVNRPVLLRRGRDRILRIGT